MAVEINNVNAQVSIRESSTSTTPSANSNSANVQDVDTLRELIRPMVMEIIQEELNEHMRQRG
ncbi:hypothetical protein [Teredinibacter sp. KSP-S5-2]|uniref:hypothetical protein n=1 Tax=Teredinibacter sp. KSP-S5-2 TaxID=3034506 RepID=UPI0029341B26|nr:hypothetical protein [Teredinibacter sp. KSP-S5-2]WNO11497.1 hypothetical protein P5V12_09965 [Teredinibacter sp. KSP-S5-2]